MSKLWGGRFQKQTDQLTDEFNASITFDQEMYKEDIQGSLAHAKMLGKQGILTQKEVNNICSGLEDILKDIEEGKIEFSLDQEDIHMNIETLLTERIGEDGKKLHTGRSRNDQVATDFRLYVFHITQNILEELKNLLSLLLEKSEENLEIAMPGFTHLQIAQPVTVAHYLLCYFQMFYRDYKRFSRIAKDTMSELPLGAGALAGTTYPLDRYYSAQLLGFENIKENSMDAVSDRDFAIDFLEACAVTMMHLSRFCEEIILFNSQEFRFITLDDAYTTGSSIMPQKKNPDLAELIRGKTGRAYGNLISLLTTMKGLPLAYNKDMQEDKEPIIDSYHTVYQSLQVFIKMLDTMTIHSENLRNAMERGFINATDLADYLVKQGIPFRDAHEITGRVVLYCEENNKKINELSLEKLRTFSPVINSECFKAIDIEKIINDRNLVGGPSPETNLKLIQNYKQMLENLTD